ncbi:MAG TPA: efflux RND transporter periplasmic adaptor subunit [Gemmatimonadota bacterium]|nr:efflux RND transporter periplasmic adaptor subunit [Gemmatimonadota bacterium]
MTKQISNRTAWIGGGLVLLLLAAAILLVSRPRVDERPEPPSAAGTSGTEGMPGMAGMEMGDEGSIRLTADEIRTFGVTFGTAERRPIERTIRAIGRVDFDETRMAYVTPKFGGFVERLHVDFEGKPVSRGQPLLEIYSPELVSAQEELLLARRLGEKVGASGVEGVAAGSADLLASVRRRLRYWDISDAQIDRILATGEVRKTLTLHSPVSGIVMEKNVFGGQAVKAGESLYMIADLSRVWVEAELFESDAALVHEGMDASIVIAALPGRTFGGRVEYVYPTFGEKTRSMKARIGLPNSGGVLKPGMYATVRLERVLGEVLTVPRSAVLNTGEKAVAFVDMGDGRLMPHELALGIAGDEHVEVLKGLQPGQRVVTSAQFLLDSESNLAEVMRAMMAQMNLSDMESMEGMDVDGAGMEGMDMWDEGMEGMRAPADTASMRGMEMLREKE